MSADPSQIQATDQCGPTFRVVRVLNARELVVSGGEQAGLGIDDVLRVLGEPFQLEDPVTGEDLGSLRTTKALVRVYDVAPRYALARTFRSRQVRVSGSPMGALDLFSPPKYETRTETLERDRSSDLTGDGAVQVGDLVERWEGAVEDVPSVTAWV